MTNTVNPYVRGLAKEIFEAAVHGTTREKIDAKIKKAEVTPHRIWRELKLGDFRGVRWSYSEDEKGNIKITVKAKAAKKEEKPSKPVAAKPNKLSKLAKEESAQADKREKKAKKAHFSAGFKAVTVADAPVQ